MVAGMVIDGGLVTEAFDGDGAGRARTVIDPSSGRAFATVPEASGRDVDRAMSAAAAAAPVMEDLAPVSMQRLLLRLAGLLDRDRGELARLTVREVGKPIGQAQGDVAKAIEWFEYYAGWATKISGETLSTSIPLRSARTVRRPVGPVVAVTPWNYPLMIAAWKVAPALAARCPVVLKPPESAPLSSLKLGELALEAGLGSWLQVVTGDGRVGQALVGDARAAAVSFTGSYDVGRQVGRVCGEQLRRHTLELGGKSALIVDGPLDEARAALVADAVIHNAGQACNAPGRLLLARRSIDEDVGRLLAALDRTVVGDPVADGVDMGPLQSGRQVKRVARLLQLGADAGDRLAPAGVAHDGRHTGGFWCHPVVARVATGSPLWREEVFGPVVAVGSYGSIEEAIAEANMGLYGLAAGVLTESVRVAGLAERSLRCGHVYVNHWSSQDPSAAFGGYRGSGVGRSHGRDGLEAFLTTTTVWSEF